MDDTLYGTRDKRGDWKPNKLLQYPPVFIWPAKPVAFLKWFFGYPGYLMPWNVVYAAVATLLWLYATPSMETMKTLAAKGLVVPRARIGTRVTPRAQWNLFDSDILTWQLAKGVDEVFLLDLSEVRLAFEPHAAVLAARFATDADISHMMRLAMAMGDPEHTAETLALADLRFHLSVLDASRNPFFRTIGSLIEAALVGVFRLSSPARDRGKIDDVAATHIRIVEEIRRRDEEGARRAMENVIRVGRDRVVEALNERRRASTS